MTAHGTIEKILLAYAAGLVSGIAWFIWCDIKDHYR